MKISKPFLETPKEVIEYSKGLKMSRQILRNEFFESILKIKK